MGDAGAAWTLIQVAALLRSADELLLEAVRTLGPDLHAGLPEDAARALSADDLARLRDLLAELADASDRLRVLGDSLPDDAVELSYEHVRAETAEQLASGIADPGRALLAARTLGVADGWQALADGLRVGDAHLEWTDTSVAQLLRRFRGASAARVRDALAQAGVDADATFAEIPPHGVAALARVLEAHAAAERR